MKALLLSLLEKLKRLSPGVILALGLGYVLAVGGVDYMVPERLRFTLFYAVGSAFVGWGAGKPQATVIALVSSIAMIVDDWHANLGPVPLWISLWNISTRVIVVMAAGWISAEATRLTRNLGKLVEERTAQWKQEAQQHKTTSESLRVFLDAVPEAAFLLDTQGSILVCNQALALNLSRAHESLVGQNAFELMPLPVAQTRKEMFEQVLRSGKPVQYEDSRDGKHFMNFESPVLDSEGKVSRVAVVALNITQRKRAEQQLADALDFNQKMIAASPMGIAAYKASGECIFCNQALARIVGGTQTQILQGNFHSLRSWQQSGLLRLAEEALELNQARTAEVQDTSRFGKTFWVDALMAPFVSAGEVHLLHMAYEITERKRLERQILEISDREQARIGQDIHDGLCQQLVSLAFDANALERQLAAKHQPETATAKRIADLLDRAITEARQLSRGLFPIRLETEGLLPALEELARTARERFGVECRLESPERMAIHDRAIATHLYRIAQEAVSNAVKHARPHCVTIQLRPLSDGLELRVVDDGCGLAATSLRKAGSMGLHIMEYRAGAIGGALHLASGVQGGTVVICRLPRT